MALSYLNLFSPPARPRYCSTKWRAEPEGKWCPYCIAKVISLIVSPYTYPVIHKQFPYDHKEPRTQLYLLSKISQVSHKQSSAHGTRRISV